MDEQNETILLEMPASAEIVNVTEICRLCAKKHEKLIGIYSEEGETNDLESKMNSYLPIKVDKNDNLPLQCCWQCTSTLLNWHELVISTIEANRRFQSYQFQIEKLENETETDLLKVEHSTHEEKSETTVRNKEANFSNDDDSDLEYTKVELKNSKNRRKKIETNSIFECNVCRKTFTRKFDMQRHISKKHPEESIEPSTRSKNLELLNTRRVIDKDVVYYECDVCDIRIKKSTEFVQHYNIHINKKLHCCHLCGKIFQRSTHLQRHINQLHHKVRNYSCEYCEQTFTSQTSKKDHVNIHTNNRPYMCPLCGKSFKQSSSLYVHKMFHEQNFRFSCNICDKKFRRNGDLKKHQQRHTGERDYNCDVCNKSFPSNQALKRHKKIHT